MGLEAVFSKRVAARQLLDSTRSLAAGGFLAVLPGWSVDSKKWWSHHEGLDQRQCCYQLSRSKA